MKIQERPGPIPIWPAILMTIAMLVIAGCLGSAPGPQETVTPASDMQSKNPVAPSPVTTKTIPAPEPVRSPQSAPAPVSSTGVIMLDPISDRNTGDSFTLTGTTSLPEGTNIFWQIMPDTGTPPTGLEPESQMSVGGNYLVVKGNEGKSRISVAVELGRLVPGKYVAIVGKMKGDGTTGIVFEIGKDYGYTYFTLK